MNFRFPSHLLPGEIGDKVEISQKKKKYLSIKKIENNTNNIYFRLFSSTQPKIKVNSLVYLRLKVVAKPHRA